MTSPSRSQWIVLWLGAIWCVGSLLIAEDYVWRAIAAGGILTALGYFQLQAKANRSREVSKAPVDVAAFAGHPSGTTGINDVSVLPQVARPSDQPVGVRGWLALIVVGLLLAPFFVLVYPNTFGQALRFPSFLALSIVVAISAAASVYTGAALANRWQNAPVIGQRYFLLSVPLSIAILAIAVIGGAADASRALGQVFGAVVGPLVWVRYFQKSKRVRNTYTAEAPPGRVTPFQAAVLAGSVGLIALMASLALYRSETWITHASPTGHYSVQGPAPLKVSTDNSADVPAYVAVFGNDYRGFSVTDFALAQGAEASAVLDGLQEHVVKQTSGTLMKSVAGESLHGYSSRSFTVAFTVDGTQGEADGKAIVTNDHVYLLLGSGTSGGRIAEDFERFAKSFEILP